MCGKDLCDKCVAHEEYNAGDYRTVYCSKCWRIGIEYLEKIKILEDEIENLNTEWLRKCLCLDKQVRSCETCKHESSPICLTCNKETFPDWKAKTECL